MLRTDNIKFQKFTYRSPSREEEEKKIRMIWHSEGREGGGRYESGKFGV